MFSVENEKGLARFHPSFSFTNAVSELKGPEFSELDDMTKVTVTLINMSCSFAIEVSIDSGEINGRERC